MFKVGQFVVHKKTGEMGMVDDVTPPQFIRVKMGSNGPFKWWSHRNIRRATDAEVQTEYAGVGYVPADE